MKRDILTVGMATDKVHVRTHLLLWDVFFLEPGDIIIILYTFIILDSQIYPKKKEEKCQGLTKME